MPTIHAKLHYADGFKAASWLLKRRFRRTRKHASVPKNTPTDEPAVGKPTTKPHRHGPSATRGVGISTSDAPPISSSRHMIGSARKRIHNMAPKVSTRSEVPVRVHTMPPLRHRVAAGRDGAKRRIRPSQKSRESE